MQEMKLAKLQSLPSKYYLLDLEFATHKKTREHLPLEIGVVKYQNGHKVGKQFHRFVYWADAEADDLLRGIDYANVTYKTYKKQGQWDKIVTDLLNFLDFSLPIGGWNVHGDLQVLIDAINNHGGPQVDEKTVCCFEVDELASWLGELPNKPSLRGMGRLLGLDVSNMHHALADVLLTAQVYDYLISLPELASWQNHGLARETGKQESPRGARARSKQSSDKSKPQNRVVKEAPRSKRVPMVIDQPKGKLTDLDQKPVSLGELAQEDGSIPVAVVFNPKQTRITNDQSVIDQLANHCQHHFKRVSPKEARLGLLLDTNSTVPRAANKQSAQFRYLADHQVPILSVANLAKEFNIKTEKGTPENN
ncbi:3'-5' exonuclease [Limosilactobacillus gorillae]|jgi:DNA polymerase III epsilon subunit-like protein|uniref:3'-5' exonuclease n=1 Tax=Limosilactobacillus gorillae TaxID=1450649 RepID=UPI000B15DBC6|nr:hypothetical protein [Limosilactobacillus gorillae]